MTTEQERQVALLLKDRILAGMDQPIRQIILYGFAGRRGGDVLTVISICWWRSRSGGQTRREAATASVFNGRTIRGGCVGHGGDGVRGNQRGHRRVGLSGA